MAMYYLIQMYKNKKRHNYQLRRLLKPINVMANIQSTNKTIQEVAEYLEANGFTASKKRLTGTFFTKDDRGVLIYADKASFRRLDVEGQDPEFCEYQLFEGINLLSFTDWIYLLHITQTLSLKSALKEVRQEFASSIDFPAIIQNIFGHIKTACVILFFLSCVTTTEAQEISAQMRIGLSTKTADALVAPALNFTAHNITLAPEMVINTKDNAPVDFGLKLSYQYKIFEAGAARYFALFSTDAYDKRTANGWLNSYFLAVHCHKLFGQIEYADQIKLSIGIKEVL
jgi:hypothetical protein